MKSKYVPDLTRQMAQCESNYMRLLRLMPDFDDCDERAFQVSVQEHSVRVTLRVDERFAYTSTVEISQQHEHDSRWLQAPALLVRLYHDAGMAEVVCVRRRQMAGVYPYPNPLMHQPDEKAQLNDYLAEWLGHCLSHGHLIEPVYAR
ncbi:MAG: DUF1249 domain-containing protein [Marinobacterium sp.]|nr:DUF1249 domain-containing protein [Marinobacterium sp.]